ncbi:MAG: ATP--guanido phosphotransferase [Phycisphaera sp.]|nr:ATP--guanido phosphotransferase [Phycisphaera sp.]
MVSNPDDSARGASPWQRGGADDPRAHDDSCRDCVLSSRVRLARNLVGFNFVNRSTPEQLSEVVHRVQAARLGGPFEGGVRWVNVQATAALDRLMLFERNLISRPFVEAQHPRCVAISTDESTSVMVNEEDHLRLQMLAPGLQLRPLAARMLELDRTLERSLEYAFHPRFGYLTACPTNVGTGIRVSAMMHLPALRLLEELDKVQRAAKDMHLAVRGFHGEGTDALGDFFQISNQTTLGRTEEDLVEEFAETIVPRFVEYERAARRALLERDRLAVDDRAHRSLGLLRSARLLSLDECIKHLSRVRLGVALGRIEHVELAHVDRLLLEAQPAHLAHATGLSLGIAGLGSAGADDRAARATAIRGAWR